MFGRLAELSLVSFLLSGEFGQITVIRISKSGMPATLWPELNDQAPSGCFA